MAKHAYAARIMAEAQVAEVYADYNEIDRLLRQRLMGIGDEAYSLYLPESNKAWDAYEDAKDAIERLKVMLNDLR